MTRAVGVEVTEEIPTIPGWVMSASETERSPCRRLRTPGGKPACSISSNRRWLVIGTCSDGLTMAALPQATAYGQNQLGTMAGKLNGGMMANTPSGTRSAY